MHNMLNKIIAPLVILMAVWCVYVSSAVGSDIANNVPAVAEDALPVEIAGAIMKVDTATSSLGILEKQIIVAPFMLDGKLHTPQLTDAKGKKVGFDFFEEKQRVWVQGYRVDKFVVYAEKVRLIDNNGLEKERRTIQKMTPADTQ